MIATWYKSGVVSKDTAHPFMFTETNFRSVTSSELPAGIHQKQQMMNFKMLCTYDFFNCENLEL